MNAVVRLASPADARELAVLRYEWSPPPNPPSNADPLDFAAHLEAWLRQQGDRCVCVIAIVDGEPIGMAWLAVFERVPNPGERLRLSGDIQSVYVRPALRNGGIGARLVAVLLEEADRRGITDISVHSSEEALPFYRRLGFEDSDRRLDRPRPL